MKGLTLKPLSQTRWESRVESVKEIRYQAPQIGDVLIHLASSTKEPKTKSEVESLATHELENFEFLGGVIIWYNLLFAFNTISKFLQSEDILIDVAMDRLKGPITHLGKYRETGFVDAIIEANVIASEMGIEPVFHEKRIICQEKQFGWLFPEYMDCL